MLTNTNNDGKARTEENATHYSTVPHQYKRASKATSPFLRNCSPREITLDSQKIAELRRPRIVGVVHGKVVGIPGYYLGEHNRASSDKNLFTFNRVQPLQLVTMRAIHTTAPHLNVLFNDTKYLVISTLNKFAISPDNNLRQHGMWFIAAPTRTGNTKNTKSGNQL